MSKKIKVLIVDDSAVVRKALTDIISSDPELEVIGTAGDPVVAVDKIKKQEPDVITLDIEMPRMDGLTFLGKIMSQHPIPVVIISSLVGKSSESAMRAVENGAVDVIQKPKLGVKQFIEESKTKICDTVKAASYADLKLMKKQRMTVKPKLSADSMIAKQKVKAMAQTTDQVVAIGASTGGTQALELILTALPANSPGIVIVQHMPEKFTANFARRLNEICAVHVKEAENNDTVLPGSVLIAPGGRHMLLKRSGARYFVEIKDGPLVSRHKPSVDVLFRSTARYAGKNSLGIILTGMGDDGATGLLEMKEAGAHTVAQDEFSSVVYGMPKVAFEKGAADTVLHLDEVANYIIKYHEQHSKKVG